MKMRYAGPPPLPRVTLTSQHHYGSCQQEKEEEAPKGTKIQYTPSHASTPLRETELSGHLAW